MCFQCSWEQHVLDLVTLWFLVNSGPSKVTVNEASDRVKTNLEIEIKLSVNKGRSMFFGFTVDLMENSSYPPSYVAKAGFTWKSCLDSGIYFYFSGYYSSLLCLIQCQPLLCPYIYLTYSPLDHSYRFSGCLVHTQVYSGLILFSSSPISFQFILNSFL